jgi:hypothetical protein
MNRMNHASLPDAGDLRHRRFEVANLLVLRDLPNLHPHCNRTGRMSVQQSSGHMQNAYALQGFLSAAEDADGSSIADALQGFLDAAAAGSEEAMQEHPKCWLIRMENGSARPWG